jgi:tetratricopeptide (TPR) repeat protein
VQIAVPARQVEPPNQQATTEELEKKGDELRATKDYLDAIDYFRAALAKSPSNAAALYNKMGISELMLQRPKDARRDFEQAIHRDHQFSDAYNNLGVSDYMRRKYGPAVKQYKKALAINPQSASFYNNLGAAYFARKDFERATQAYLRAVELDPQIFEHTSRTGISAQVASPQDRAHYDYIIAKLYAKAGDRDRSLEFLRKAMEEGYKGIKDALTDPEFADLRKDQRFAELMKSKTPAIPE